MKADRNRIRIEMHMVTMKNTAKWFVLIDDGPAVPVPKTGYKINIGVNKTTTITWHEKVWPVYSPLTLHLAKSAHATTSWDPKQRRDKKFHNGGRSQSTTVSLSKSDGRARFEIVGETYDRSPVTGTIILSGGGK